ncbi:MAG: PAS domain S-box protein [Desulfobacterales bacterium]|nr:MAG: PAS domain S-box protein [Desulfobacterales bacterium]
MQSDALKSRDELVQELNSLRQQAGDWQKRLQEVEKAHEELQRRLEARAQAHERECAARDRTEEALRMAELIIDKSPVILFRRLAGPEPRLVYVSNNINQSGYTAEEFLSGQVQFKDIVHPDDTERVGQEIKAYADQDVEEYTQVYRILTRGGEVRWVEDQTSVVRDAGGRKTYYQGVVVDVTQRKLAEDRLRKSEEKYRRIVETAGEGFILMDHNLVIVDVNAAYCQMTGFAREEIIGKSPLDLATDEFRQFLPANREELLAGDYRRFEGAVLTKDGRQVPILVHGSVLRDDRGKIIGNMAFVTDMTEHKKALALAGEVQKSLLPQDKPGIPGLDVAGRNVSCDEIGGDYFDFLWRRERPHGPFSVVVGDITGHGVDSALLMTSARAFLRMRASQPGTMAEIVTAMNRHLARDVVESGRFMTLFYLTIDGTHDRVAWVRAGHDPALVYDPAGDRFEELKGPGIALGVDETFEYGENYRSGLAPGQIIAVGTDGIWEACNKEGQMFGKERFRDIIRHNARAGADDILHAVYRELTEFMRGRRSEDDITLVIIKVHK